MGAGQAQLLRVRTRLTLALAAVTVVASSATAQAKPSRSRRQPAVAPAPGPARPAPVRVHPSVKRRGVVLEVYPRERTAGAEALVAPMVAALSMHGFATGPGQVGTAIAARLSRPARVVDHLDAEELAREIESGYRAYLVGQFPEAVETMARSIAAAHQNPSAVALDQNLAGLVQRALLGQAQALRRLGRDTEAFEAVAEHVRSFPEASISARQYSPEIREFRQAVELALTRQGRGTLRVEVDRPEAIVFLNETFRGQGRVELDDLLPGLYRVFVQVGREDGRAYDVSVVAGRTTRLVVDWRFDASLETPPTWTGLVVRERHDWQARALDYAGRIGRAVGAPEVVLVGPDWDGASLVGTVVSSADGRAVRRAVARGRSAEARAQLTRFLAGESTDGVDVLIAGRTALGPVAARDPEPARTASWRRRLAWIGAAGAAASLTAGGVALWLDGSCREEPAPGTECPTLYDTRALGIAGVAAAASLAGLSAYLFMTGEGEGVRGAGVAAQPGGLSAFVRIDF